MTVARHPASALLLTRLGVEYGLSEADCLAGTELSVARLTDPRLTVTGEQELRIIRNLQSQVDDPVTLAMHAGRRYHLTTHGAWGFAIASSSTVADAIAVGLEFIGLTWAFSRVEAVRRGSVLRFQFHTDHLPADVAEFLAIREIASLATLGSEIGLELPALRGIAFRSARPPSVGTFVEVLEREPRWNAELDYLDVDAAALEAPLPQADLHTRLTAENQCRAELALRSRLTGTPGQVERALTTQSPLRPDIEAVAAALHVSSRTLRRRLDADGTSFRAIVDATRQALAEDLLADPSMSVEAIAMRLGYSTTPAFTNAFKRWTGQSPRAFRTTASWRAS